MFFVIQITKKNGVTSNTIFNFDTIEEAKENYYYFLTSSYSDSGIDFILAMIVSSDGFCLSTERYERPAPAPEPEPIPELEENPAQNLE